MPKSALEGEKASLRRSALAARRRLSPGCRQSASRLIVEAVLRSPLLRSAECLLGYWPCGTEVDLSALLAALHEGGKRVLVPHVAEGLELFEAVPWSPDVSLQPGPYGLLQPPLHLGGPLPDPDLVLVPGLAFDRSGGRLGQGKGYYDRYLAGLPRTSVRIGVGFEAQVLEAIPMGPLDVPMAYLVTERGLRLCGQGAPAP